MYLPSSSLLQYNFIQIIQTRIIEIVKWKKIEDLLIFYKFDSLCPSQHVYSHDGTGLPGLNHIKTEDKASC